MHVISPTVVASAPVGGKLSFDVLVIGSGASGLAAAVSAERDARGSHWRPREHSSRATRPRHKGGSRRRSVRTTRPRSMPKTSGAARTRRPTGASSRSSPPRLRPRSTGSRSSASSSRARTAATACPLRRRVAEAPAPGRRPDGARDHDRTPRSLRGRFGDGVPEVAADRARTNRERLASPMR